MLISYDRPDDITLSLIGDGATWLSGTQTRCANSVATLHG